MESYLHRSLPSSVLAISRRESARSSLPAIHSRSRTVCLQQPMQIEPINAAQQQRVARATHACIRHTGDLLDYPLQPVQVSFALTGRAAGMYRVQGGQREIRYNPYIFGKYFADNLATTIPHEVAHYATDVLYGLRNVRPHGKEWRAIMQLLGADPAVVSSTAS